MNLPIALKIENKQCLIIGGGKIALEKALKLLRHNVKLTIIARECTAELLNIAKQGTLKLILREYQESDMQSTYDLVICATNDLHSTKLIYQHAKAKKILFNAVDTPEYCDFYFTCDYHDEDFTVSISTEGRCPLLASYIRDLLAKKLKTLRPVFKKILHYRQHLKQTIDAQPERAFQLRKFFQISLKQQHQSDDGFLPGHVYFVGAGPGDRFLITLRGKQALQSADVILYDELANKELLEEAIEPCLAIYVGKKAEGNSTSQDKINHLLLQYAQEHKIVVRLKGGSPGIYSRVMDEITILKQHNIPYGFIPGLSAGTAIIQALNLPLTARNVSDRILFMTGQFADKKPHDLSYLQHNMQGTTFVIFMGYKVITTLVNQFIEAGFPLCTPIAIMQSITTDDQTIILETLGNVLNKMISHCLPSPVIIVIGEILMHHSAFTPEKHNVQYA